MASEDVRFVTSHLIFPSWELLIDASNHLYHFIMKIPNMFLFSSLRQRRNTFSFAATGNQTMHQCALATLLPQKYVVYLLPSTLLYIIVKDKMPSRQLLKSMCSSD